ncbi:hypothetical protein PC116_g18357 [Phytophthora cactorum]|uniref:Uncharacterized protein n=1 Tax=Phytophthora cactorum TaxID=29920 RepID=A0A329RSY8_9STRA|nr:hypothetical protein PC111_g18149 [Phytophthora cactorum]KAG2841437.1 hypothetical protein PC113_g19034 [Phytophthora cactorum]KAG2893380.1 hypothetical protein PC115_g18488 [Phytophthora cactorum]KAG2893497.1 hypothetical protein PC114_g16232 [Phytophthora cactorum]KAG2925941.1 hypothetical protein PC117_g15025 [Phytophthora cactorum]
MYEVCEIRKIPASYFRALNYRALPHFKPILRVPSTATQVIERLNRQWEDETSNLAASHENFGDAARHVEEEASDPGSPILAEYTALVGDDTLKGMTNFSAPELDAL